MAKTTKQKRPTDQSDVSASLGTPPHRRHVKVKPSSYQPSKAELEADVSVKATPEGLRDMIVRSVVVKESNDARRAPARPHHLAQCDFPI